MKYFTVQELECKGTGLLRLHPGFPEALIQLREEMDEPMVVTSCCRSAAHNRAVGGHPRSLHVGDVAQYPGQQGTLAIDIAVLDGEYRGKLFALAWKLGWSIGWNSPKKFLHLDRRDWVGLKQTTFDY